MDRSSTQHESTPIYAPTARRLHWLTVALLALQLPVGLYMVYRGNTLNLWDALTGALYSIHKLVGVLILVLVVGRLLYRSTRGAPPPEPSLDAWQRSVSGLVHWALYALLVAAPIAGYVGISMFPALDVFGLKLPALTGPDKEGAKTAFLIHGWLVMALVALVAMHVGAALFHYFVRKDDVLGRMVPGLLRSQKSGPRSR